MFHFDVSYAADTTPRDAKETAVVINNISRFLMAEKGLQIEYSAVVVHVLWAGGGYGVIRYRTETIWSSVFTNYTYCEFIININALIRY